MRTGDIIYLILSFGLAGAMIGISIYYLFEGNTLIGLCGILLAITNSADALNHVRKWNKFEQKIRRKTI